MSCLSAWLKRVNVYCASRAVTHLSLVAEAKKQEGKSIVQPGWADLLDEPVAGDTE